jgi:hypothetical protein
VNGTIYGTVAAGDNLGNHTATQDLLMAGNDIYNASTIAATGNITAARYQINGSTMVAILPGVGSIAYGPDAGRSNAASYNTFIGKSAGYSNTTGSNNTANGFGAAYYTQTGSQNAVYGYQAAYGVSNNSFSSSTIVGAGAGYNITTGGDNTLLGWQAGYNVTSGTGNIVIGYNDNTSAPTASNELVIGEVLFGKLDSKTIGISTRNPQAALDVLSTGTASNVYAQIWRNSAGTIVSSMTATGVLYPAITASDDTKVAKTGDTMTGQLTLSGSTLTIMAPDTQAASLWVSTSAATPHFYISTNGYVGIGAIASADHQVYVPDGMPYFGKQVYPSTTLRLSANTERSITNTLVLKKSFIVPYAGAVTVSVDSRADVFNTAEIFVKVSSVTEAVFSVPDGSSYTTYSANIPLGRYGNNLIEIWGIKSGSGNSYLKNCRVYYDIKTEVPTNAVIKD